MTTSPENFGEIRSILQQTPSPEAWEALCDQIALWSWPHYETFEQQILPYLLHHLESWPDALRGAPDRWRPGLLRAAPMPWAPMIRALDASAQGFSVADMETLTMAPVLPHLTALDLSQNRFGAAGLQRLMQSRKLRGLRSLRLADVSLGVDGALPLLDADALPRLDTLDMSNTGINSRTLDALGGLNLRAREEPLPALRALVLDRNMLGERAIGALRRTRHARQLERLSLAQTSLTMRSAVELTYAPATFMALHTLDLSENQLGEQTAQLFARNAQLPALRSLALRGNLIGPEGARALAQGGALNALETLDLRRTQIGAAGAIALTARGALPALRLLIIHQRDVGQNGWEALAERFPSVHDPDVMSS